MIYNKKDTLNIIKINGESITLEKEDGSIKTSLSDKLDFYDIDKMNIEVLKDTSLLIIIKGNKEIKLDVELTLKKNVNLTLYELRETKSLKIQEKFFLYDNSSIQVERFYDNKILKELNLVCLNGKDSKYESNNVGIIKDKSKLDIMTYHNFPGTISNIENKFTTILNGVIDLTVTSMVYKGMKKSIINQKNNILNQNSSKSMVKPNLLIEENDTEANHSCNISPFDKDEIFYLKSRGIKEVDAIKLLLKGYLENNIVDISSKLKKYWG